MRYVDPLSKPEPYAPDFDAIPSPLCALNQWVLWRFDWIEERTEWAKVPYNPWTLNKAKSNDPTTWGGFETAVASFTRHQTDFAGIGFVFSPQDTYCGIDFDRCVDAEGELSPIASHWVGRLGSYTEMSPSGTGVHTIVEASVGAGRNNQKIGIEIYDSGRYFAFTGRSWHESPLDIIPAQEQVNSLLAEVFTPQPEPVSSTTSVHELVQIAFRAQNGAKIRALYEGDTSAYAGDDSAADLALCNLLAFYSGGDAQLLDGMFRASRLMRRKWDEKHYADGRTYGQATISEALATCTEFYGLKNEPQAESASGGIRTADHYIDELEELYQTGYVAGVSPGWPSLASHYTVKPGQWTVVTGSPGAGKSVWLNALLVNLACAHHWRFAICSPEFWPVSTHIAELMALYVGQPFVQGAVQRMSQQTAREALVWVKDHFTFIEPVEHSLTMEYVLNVAAEIHKQQVIQGVVIDPWTEFEQDRLNGETETDFTKRKLTDFSRFVRLNMLHGWIVAHPKMLKRDSGGQYPIPTLYDISGSAHWYNKTYMGISLHRPDWTSTRVQVHVQKVKFRWCGKLGQVELYYDVVTGRYSETAPSYEHYMKSVEAQERDAESKM